MLTDWHELVLQYNDCLEKFDLFPLIQQPDSKKDHLRPKEAKESQEDKKGTKSIKKSRTVKKPETTLDRLLEAPTNKGSS